MNEPTIDEAISWVQSMGACDLVKGGRAEGMKLALIALEEMRDRDNALHLAQTILFRMRPNWAQGPDLCFCLRAILRAMDEELPPKTISKPRTWRDVTAGEIMDTLYPSLTLEKKKVKDLAGWTLTKYQLAPLGHEPRLGSQFPEEKP